MPAETAAELREVSCVYRRRRWQRGEAGAFTALDRVSLAIPAGARFGIAGRSGSGKTTFARCLSGLLAPTSGEVRIGGASVYGMDAAAARSLRRRVQMVWQGAGSTFHPHMTAREAAEEPLLIQAIGTAPERRARAEYWSEQVGLPPACLGRLAIALSGGQQQRLAIARAMTLEPEILVLDEVTAHLDLSVQAQVLNLLLDLNQSRGITLVMICHDLGVLAHAVEQVAVFAGGRIVEQGSAAELLGRPARPETRELLEAVLPFPC